MKNWFVLLVNEDIIADQKASRVHGLMSRSNHNRVQESVCRVELIVTFIHVQSKKSDHIIGPGVVDRSSGAALP